MKPLFLVGYMGCGKSTLGRKLARRLGVDFIDTDALVEEREGASVADVFRYEGEERFREAERRVLDEVIAGANVNSCWYALQSMTGKTVLILGGKDKGKIGRAHV